MAGLKELKRRLDSIRKIEKVAGAMKSAATAKYSVLSKLSSSLSEYSLSVKELLSELGLAGAFEGKKTPERDAPSLFVIISGNRGLCGGFNYELFSFFTNIYLSEKEKGTAPLVVTCGKKSKEYCASNSIVLEKSYETQDIPEYETAKELSEYLCNEYREGRIKSVRIVYQKFENVMSQKPDCKYFLPEDDGLTPIDDDGGVSYYPDRKTVGTAVVGACLIAELYSLMLESALGLQAATLTSMRTAYDNAEESEQILEKRINTTRQGEITSGVIETAQNAEE